MLSNPVETPRNAIEIPWPPPFFLGIDPPSGFGPHLGPIFRGQVVLQHRRLWRCDCEARTATTAESSWDSDIFAAILSKYKEWSQDINWGHLIYTYIYIFDIIIYTYWVPFFGGDFHGREIPSSPKHLSVVGSQSQGYYFLRWSNHIDSVNISRLGLWELLGLWWLWELW